MKAEQPNVIDLFIGLVICIIKIIVLVQSPLI